MKTKLEDKNYYKIYESKVANATVKIKTRFNADKIAKAIVMIVENDFTDRVKNNEQKE